MGSLQADLMHRSAYQRPGRVELIETHISLVFLVGGEVFKVKKAVDLGFLDFRTLEQRRLACEAEVTLNRRLAPDVYLGVVPVRRDATGRHRLKGDGEVVDWAVHMVRLPDERRGDRLLALHLLTPAHLELLARRLAEFHAHAPSDQHLSSFGTAEAIAVNVHENFAQTRGQVSRYLDPAQADEITRWQLEFLREEPLLFAQRVSAGRVRDGHGDLRLEHVYFGPGEQVTILDCIEFNERFRYADVCSDLAFLSMDLAWSGRVDLAERLLAAYARETDDYDLYSVVDFYESYRAWVRGKIAALNDDAARPQAAEHARRYLLLALASKRRSMLRPQVIAVGGVIASGKSTVADRVGAELAAPVIDADRTRKHLLGVAPTQSVAERPWQGAYDPHFTDQVYDEVFRRARVVLASGRPVVLDASFRSRALRERARALAADVGVSFRFLECRAPAPVCRARLEERSHHQTVSDGRLAIFDDFCARYEPVDELAPDQLLVVDTTRPVDDTLGALRKELSLWPQGLVA